MTTYINGAYLDGIAEGRSFLKANPNLTLEDMKRCYQNACENVKRHNFAMKDCFKGERDFWKNQLKIRIQENDLSL